MNVSPTIKDYMNTKVVCLTEDMDILDASQILVDKQLSGAPVVDDTGSIIGFLSTKDCFKITMHAGYLGEPGGKITEYMSRDVKCVNENMSIMDMAELFLNSHYRRYPVVADNRLTGIISRRDILRAILKLA
jgi:predicted transcriptional regulator